ncbi:MAG: ABC transporter ATP-binding protein [Rhodobacteraceae bacterium]|nr:ABC transporter ATP-binding protein [Paracoccaceae bacterium]
MIRLRQVHKKFGGRVAVESLDLEVKAGDILGLLGHNGAGKSTAIGMMLGQVWPDSGEVRVCGADVTRQRTAALREVGAIFESPVFYDYLSGWRNLEILAQYAAPVSRARIAEVIDWVGLTGRERSKVRTYSHGMRARLALAQALLPGPRLLILDEPSDGLDPEGIAEMRQTVLRLHRDLGLTILFSSHQLTEVAQICTRIAVLRQGRKVFDGAIADMSHSRRRLRLVVDRPAEALAELRAAAMVVGSDGNLSIELAPSVEADAVARRLVELGFRLFEIGPEEQTLERFYLSLMRAGPEAG